ncbi:hypothetical protein ACWAUC_27615 [Bradyrhizobium guangdongense]
MRAAKRSLAARIGVIRAWRTIHALALRPLAAPTFASTIIIAPKN